MHQSSSTISSAHEWTANPQCAAKTDFSCIFWSGSWHAVYRPAGLGFVFIVPPFASLAARVAMAAEKSPYHRRRFLGSPSIPVDAALPSTHTRAHIIKHAHIGSLTPLAQWKQDARPGAGNRHSGSLYLQKNDSLTNQRQH